MFNSQLPPLSELPTSRQLVGSTFLAAGAAAVLLATVVLPSEYGIDPTGIGKALSLTQMGEIKQQLANEAAADAAQDQAAAAISVEENPAPVSKAETKQAASAYSRSDVTRVTLAPGEGAEVKVTAAKAARIAYEWSVEGGVVNYDTHADAPGISYHGYSKGKQSAGEKATLVAAFDGKHGWFWRNRTGKPVTVILKTSGAYTEIKRVV